MKKPILFIFLLTCVTASAQYAVVESHVVQALSQKTGQKIKTFNKTLSGHGIIKLNAKKQNLLSHISHNQFNSCGGYFGFDTKKEAESFIKDLDSNVDFAVNKDLNLSLSMESFVDMSLKTIQTSRVEKVIRKLSSFHNRYYQSQTGLESQQWLRAHWEKLTAHRSDVTTEFIKHKKKILFFSKPILQPSLVLTIKGSVNPEKIVVLGGHADSINAKSKHKHAPGADDNASGIASLTEALKVIMDANYKPKNTLMFMAYAAEEVGLLGSKDIAKRFRKGKKDVLGVLQLDMTNFQGDPRVDIHLVENKTNKKLNTFLGKLIDTYIQIPWGYTDIGMFASSDHAAWAANRFPSTFPTESSFKTFNKNIHTENDTIDISMGNADHAVKFAKLAAAFAIEMGK